MGKKMAPKTAAMTAEILTVSPLDIGKKYSRQLMKMAIRTVTASVFYFFISSSITARNIP